MLRTPLCALVVAILLAGCAAAPGADPPGSAPEKFTVRVRADAPSIRAVVPIPAEAAMAALPRILASLGFPGGEAVETSRQVYLTPHMRIRGRLYDGERNSDYLDCGTTPLGLAAADRYSVTFAIITQVKPLVDGSSEVIVQIDGRASERASSSNEVYCSGTGRLESAIIQMLSGGAASLR